ncbi:MAG: transcriptional regulator [Chloroflexi bacterium]|nr:transcriptional regulator [Chloroflexota bacterium]
MNRSSLPSLPSLQQALAAGAGDRLVCLSAQASERHIAESLVALANAHGGQLIIGATASGKISGLPQPEQTRQRLIAATLISDPPLIIPLPELIRVGQHHLCALQVPPGLPHVYSLRGRYLIRDGQHNRPLSPPELRRLMLNRSEAGFESQVIPDATLADLDPQRIQSYQQQLIGPPTADGTELLINRGCLSNSSQGPRPTIAGILLFGIQPQRWLRSAEITCVRYAGSSMSDDFVREDIRGVLPDQIRRAEAFVVSNMRRGMRIRGLTRQETPEYPISIVREAIVNAVAHRDYSIRGDNIRVLMFSDRLEVSSPGRLPGHVTLDNLVDERFSRNEAIVQVLAEMGFIERLGYGIDRIIHVCGQEGLPPPQFTETSAGFRIALTGAGPELIGAGPPASLYAHLHLNPRQEQALTFLQNNRRITNRDYQKLCPDASPETLRRDFAGLVDRGILLKIGEKRATYYVLK